MIYRAGEWKDVFGNFCHSGLGSVDDSSYLSTLGLFKEHDAAVGLLSHQVEAAAFIASRKGAILADDMGLGKTRSALAACKFLGKGTGYPGLIVTPAGLREAWRSEIKKYWPEARIILADREGDLDEPFDFAVVSYTKLKSFVGRVGKGPIKTLIIDEAHSFKNARALYGEKRREVINRAVEGEDPRAHRTALLFTISEHIPNVYCLTGTPVLSRPKELFNLLKLIRHPLGKNFILYSTRYCGGFAGRFGWVSDGCTNPDELRDQLRNYVLRRHKKDVLSLPPKKIQKRMVDLDWTYTQKYAEAWDEYIEMVRNTRTKEETARVLQAKHLVQISLLRQICSEAKIETALGRIQSHGGKVVVFSTYTNTLQSIKNALDKAGIESVVYDGKLTEKQRIMAVERFQGDEKVRAFVAQTETAKVGLTLTAGTLVIFMDLVYTPADHFQAEDRCYRIGQRETVHIEYLICPGTVEDHLVELHETKKNTIAKIFDEDLSDSSGVITSDVSGELVLRLKKEARMVSEKRKRSTQTQLAGF